MGSGQEDGRREADVLSNLFQTQSSIHHLKNIPVWNSKETGTDKTKIKKWNPNILNVKLNRIHCYFNQKHKCYLLKHFYNGTLVISYK